MKRLLFLFLPIAAFVACEPVDVSPGSPSYQGGHLGNGGFAFTCDDSVVCGDYNAADKFPDAVALGSKFTIRYIAKSGSSSTGVTLSDVGGTHLSNLGAGDFTAIAEGVATVAAKDSGGTLVEWVELPIRRPDAIVISNTKSSSALAKTTIDIDAYDDDLLQFRASAQYQHNALAGELGYEWASSDASILRVQPNGEGRAYVTPMKAGTVTLTATGGTFSQSIEVEVR